MTKTKPFCWQLITMNYKAATGTEERSKGTPSRAQMTKTKPKDHLYANWQTQLGTHPRAKLDL
jgi:hypothetical protein